jgi:cytochrome c biogenesis protein CcmG/thiol:disulfide interchange protein DsbE
MKKLVRFIPLVLFVLLALLLYRGLFLNPQAMPSAMIGKPFPAFSLSKLAAPNVQVSQADLTGKIVLVNVWGTWCPTCKYEHPYLVNISKDPRISLYGLNYKDERGPALQWLEYYKDPYIFSIFDDEGTLGVDLGVFGAPETFVVDHRGIIRKRFAGAIDNRVWQEEFEPLIQQLLAEMG